MSVCHMCCLTLYIPCVWRSLQPQSSRNQAAVPLALLTVPRKDPSQEMKIKADPTSENEIIPCWRRPLWACCTQVLKTASPCSAPAGMQSLGWLMVAFQHPWFYLCLFRALHPLQLARNRSSRAWWGWEHGPVVQRGWLVTHKETAGWGKNHILWLGNTVKGLWKVRSGKTSLQGWRELQQPAGFLTCNYAHYPTNF